MDSNHLSLESILRLRGEAFATIRQLSAHVAMIATGIETLDVALISSTERNVDEMQSLISAAGHLASLLNCEGTR